MFVLVLQASIQSHQNEKQSLEETISKLRQDLQESHATKEEAVNVLRMKLEAAVEERGDITLSLKNEYNVMLKEKDERMISLQEEIHRVNEEFTNLGYRFEITLQDNINKGNKIVQLQNEVKDGQRVLEGKNELEIELQSKTELVSELEEELQHLKDSSNKSDSEKLNDELTSSKAWVKLLEKERT